MTVFQRFIVWRGSGQGDAGKAERTVSATQTVWERSLRREETSDASSRTAGGGKPEAIVAIEAKC